MQICLDVFVSVDSHCFIYELTTSATSWANFRQFVVNSMIKILIFQLQPFAHKLNMIVCHYFYLQILRDIRQGLLQLSRDGRTGEFNSIKTDN